MADPNKFSDFARKQAESAENRRKAIAAREADPGTNRREQEFVDSVIQNMEFRRRTEAGVSDIHGYAKEAARLLLEAEVEPDFTVIRDTGEKKKKGGMFSKKEPVYEPLTSGWVLHHRQGIKGRGFTYSLTPDGKVIATESVVEETRLDHKGVEKQHLIPPTGEFVARESRFHKSELVWQDGENLPIINLPGYKVDDKGVALGEASLDPVDARTVGSKLIALLQRNNVPLEPQNDQQP